jgi:hypothetical protein
MSCRYVFICAAGHSGSTLLNLLLGAHPQAVAVGEVTQIPKNIALNSTCSCGEELSKCAFWRPVLDGFGASIDTDLWQDPYRLNLGFIMAGREIDPAHQTRLRMLWRKLVYGAEYAGIRWGIPRLPVMHRQIRDAARQKREFLDSVLDHAGRQFAVDSSKHYIEGVSLYAAAPEQTKILLLTRDGRAVFNSGLRHGFAPKAALHAWTRHSSRSLQALRGRVPDSAWLLVRYEDLATDPESELRRIMDFIGKEFDPQMLEFMTMEQHVVAGNQMRFGSDSGIRLDERWREELTEPMRKFFEEQAGSLNRELGYGR